MVGEAATEPTIRKRWLLALLMRGCKCKTSMMHGMLHTGSRIYQGKSFRTWLLTGREIN